MSEVVMASCVCVALLFESVMLFIVLYSLLGFVRWSSLLTSAFQLRVFCSSILLSMFVLSVCICRVMSWLRGFGDVCFRVSLCLMRLWISGVKLGL